ncbi:MAG: hypothetical protein MSG64_17575 [Pyrinomonadaceae bacterium MAG19_C2-C3]|nr:hypothetical protein [Pyrinomonadaceae bacterium MAG19_C2-C3]
MAITQLGKARPFNRATAPHHVARLCPVCGEMKPGRAFHFANYKALSMVCSDCLQHRRAEAKRVFQLELPPSRMYRAFVNDMLQRQGKKRILKRKEGMKMTAEEYALKVAKLPERIAAIIGKTFAEMGDAAQLADDESLMRIRDLLLEIDETLIARNKHKRLARSKS